MQNGKESSWKYALHGSTHTGQSVLLAITKQLELRGHWKKQNHVFAKYVTELQISGTARSSIFLVVTVDFKKPLPSTLVIQNLPSHPSVVGSIFISKESEQTRLGPWTIVVLTQLEGGRLDQRAPSTCPVFLAPSQGRSVCANQIFASLAPSTTRCEVLTYRFTHSTQCANQSPRVADGSKCQYSSFHFTSHQGRRRNSVPCAS
jgi:hypothetical protein